MSTIIPSVPEDEPASSSANSSVVALATTIKHPYLNKHDSESIRLFLRKYDKYVSEVTSRTNYVEMDLLALFNLLI